MRRHLPALDGLRGVAIALVVLFHAHSAFAGGFIGVDVFFVLSGFLITTILLADLERLGEINYRGFYARRVRRLGPALALTVVLVVAIVAATGDNLDSAGLAVVVPAVVFYVANWLPGLANTGLGYFTHAWSLAIEEQFYLLWPACVRRLSRSTRPVTFLTGAALTVAVLRAVASFAIHRQVEFWTPLRADGLLLGAAVAFAADRGQLSRGFARERVAVVAAAALAGTYLILTAVSSHAQRLALLGGYFVVSAATATLVAHAVLSSSRVTSILSVAPLRALGRVSYGLYLYHFPIFMLVRTRHWSLPVSLAVELLLTALATLASYRFVETPILLRRQRARTVPVTGVQVD